jgi:tetratricopeptide (TPR) repeat protein
MRTVLAIRASWAIAVAVFSLPLILTACSNPLSRFVKQYKCEIEGKAEPRTAYQYVDRAMEHVNAEQFDCALAACSEAIRLDPRLASGYACRGGVLRNQYEYQQALKDYDKALSMQPDNGDFYYNRSLVHSGLENPEQALADLNKAIELINSPTGKSLAYSRRAEVLKKEGKLEGAVKDYTEAIRLLPTFAYHHNNRGDVYFERKEFQKAIADFTEAIKIDPANVYFYEDRAKAYRALGQEELAIKDELLAKGIDRK